MSGTSGSADNVVNDSRGRPLSPAVVAELQKALQRISHYQVARLVWDTLFTADDRQRLGNELDPCWRPLGVAKMWMKARGGTMEQAVIDVADGAKLIDPRDAARLRRELDLQGPDQGTPEDRPQWNRQLGELMFKGRVIRRVRVLLPPSNLQRILDAFEAANWAGQIRNPLALGQAQLHQTLRSLNNGLKKIRFHAQEGGKAVTWERT